MNETHPSGCTCLIHRTASCSTTMQINEQLSSCFGTWTSLCQHHLGHCCQLAGGIHSACTWNLRTRRAHQYKGSMASLRDSAMYFCTNFSDILCGTQPSRCAGHVGNFRCGDMCNWGTLRGDISHHISMHHAHASTVFVVKICS